MPSDSRGASLEEGFAELERAVHAALETYSNVHRGSGHFSKVSTRLFEEAREIVLKHLGLPSGRHVVIFCTPRRARALEARLGPGTCRCVSSQDVGLPLGIRAVAVEKRKLPRGAPVETGGGTARLVAPGWVVWARDPDRFEAGTPAIVNVVALAKALLLERSGFSRKDATARPLTAAEILRGDDGSGQELLHRLRQTLIGRDLRVPTAQGDQAYVNLDNGASTPTFEPIWSAVRQAWRQPEPVREEIVREARSICAEVLGAPAASYEVIFTSNTTEAINLVAESLCSEPADGAEPVVVNTVLEHNSNELPWRTSPALSLIRLPVDAEGFLDLEGLEALLASYNDRSEHGKQRVRLVAVTGASNVLGVFNDLAEVCRIAHRHGARVLVDAAQLVAHRKVEMGAWGIDYLAFSGHKVYAPFGSGALVARRDLLTFPADEMERIRSSGEENVGGIAALGKALVLLQRIGFDLIQEEEQALTARALRGLAQVPGLTIYGTKEPGSPRFARKGGVIAFNLAGKMAGPVARELAERGGIGTRFGCHCAHLLVKRLVGISRPLEQFQWLVVTVAPSLSLPGVARASLGLQNCSQDIDALVGVLKAVADRTSRSQADDVRQRIESFVEARAKMVYGRCSEGPIPHVAEPPTRHSAPSEQ